MLLDDSPAAFFFVPVHQRKQSENLLFSDF
jgi:hypothetical protein